MASQGWTPGDHLGVQGSAHSEFHTDANFSHIRVTIKDDNLGLGAKIGSGVGHGECTGLDAFQNLLGRLNGKDEDEIEREQKSKDDLRRAVYTEQRWGSIRFVKGGLLVGDKIQDLIEDEKKRVRKLKAEESSSESHSSDAESTEGTPVEEDRTSKKRKLDDVDEGVPEVVAVKVKKSKKQKKEKDGETKIKKSKKSRIESSSASDAEVTETLSKVKLSKKEKKAKKEALAEAEADSESSEDEEAKRIRKQDKKKRKEEKRLRKEQAKAAEADSSKESKSKSKKDKKKKDKDKSKESSRVTTVENTPVGSGTSTPVMGGRHAVRARNIAQKRLAAMDVAGLNQVSDLYLRGFGCLLTRLADFHD
jgi:Pin2-interacting protein X1